MEKRALHGIQNKKPMKQNDKKRLFKEKLKRFLVSDCFVFAPLVSRTKHLFSPSKTPFHDDGLRRGSGVEKKRKLFEKIGDYLMFDDYMYAPLVDTPVITSTTVHGESTCDGFSKESRYVDPLSNAMLEKDPSKCPAAEAETRDQQTPSQKETVKHMVYQNCRPYYLSGRIWHGLVL